MPSPPSTRSRQYLVEFELEQDGRWIAEIPELPGVMAYGQSREEALLRVEALAFRVIADKIEEEGLPQDEVRFVAA